MLFKKYFLITIIITYFSIYLLFYTQVHGISPSFLRNEIMDGTNDIYDLSSCRKYKCNVIDITAITNYNLSEKLESIDIKGVSYISDGKYLNTSLWVSSPPRSDSTYLMFIDIDSNFNTGGPGGGEYAVQLNLKEGKNTWKQTLYERSHFNDYKFRKGGGFGYAGVINQFFKNSSLFPSVNTKNNVEIDIDLKYLNFPQSFDIAFYATTRGEMLSFGYEDQTSWAHIPPPQIYLSFSENPLNMRPYETKTIYINLSSETELEPIIKIFAENKTFSNFEWTFINKNETIVKLPSYGTTKIPLKITAKNVTSEEQFSFPIFVRSSFPFKPFKHTSEILNFTNMSIQSFPDTNQSFILAINILHPMELHEHIQKFVQNWFNPLTGIYQTASGIIGGLAGFILARYKNKNSKNNKKYKQR